MNKLIVFLFLSFLIPSKVLSQDFYFGVGSGISMHSYKLQTFDTTGSGSLYDNVGVLQLGPNLTGRAAIAFDIGISTQFSIATYPSIGFTRGADDKFHLTHEIPLIAEFFFGERGDGLGGFIGGGITITGISNMPETYSSVFNSSQDFDFSAQMIAPEVVFGFQGSAFLYKLAIARGIKQPFSNVLNTYADNKNRSLLFGFSMLYQIMP